MLKNSVKSQGFGSEDVQMPNLVKNNNRNDELTDSEEYVKPLTRAEMEALLGPALLKPSRVTVKGLLIFQGLVTIISGLAWWATGDQLGSESSAISAIFGGLIAVVPGILFAARAKVLSTRTRVNALGSTVFALVTGELLKIIATIAMFILVIKFYPDLDWLPLLLTYVLALKCYWLALILRK
jgi:ATP synthase protein I